MSYNVLAFFGANAYGDDLVKVTLPIDMLAKAMAAELPNCDETITGLRKLLEAQDCFLRAAQLAKVIPCDVNEPDLLGDHG